MQNDKHSSNLQLYSNIISFQNILFRSYSNKKSFSTLQKTKFQTTSYQKLPSATIPAWATTPTVPQKFLPPSRTLTARRLLEDTPNYHKSKIHSSSSHQRLPPTPNFRYDGNHITKGSLHPGFFQLSRAAARHQNSLSVAPPWHGVEPFCWTGRSTGSRS